MNDDIKFIGHISSLYSNRSTNLDELYKVAQNIDEVGTAQLMVMHTVFNEREALSVASSVKYLAEHGNFHEFTAGIKILEGDLNVYKSTREINKKLQRHRSSN